MLDPGRAWTFLRVGDFVRPADECPAGSCPPTYRRQRCWVPARRYSHGAHGLASGTHSGVAAWTPVRKAVVCLTYAPRVGAASARAGQPARSQAAPSWRPSWAPAYLWQRRRRWCG